MYLGSLVRDFHSWWVCVIYVIFVVDIRVFILIGVNFIFLFFVIVSFVVVFVFHSCKTFSVGFVVVVGYVAIFNRVAHVVEEIKSGILIVSFGELVDAVNDQCQDKKRGKFAVFYVPPCTQV